MIMRRVWSLLAAVALCGCASLRENAPTAAGDDTIAISGVVSDFDGNPVADCGVIIMGPDFSPIYRTVTDADGHYSFDNVKKGKYKALYAIRDKEYPRSGAVPEADMRLEFWAWNVVADRDLIINPRYHRLEVYAATAFRVHNSLFVYFRPMSLAKTLKLGRNLYMNKVESEKKLDSIDISVRPENLIVNIYADDRPLKILSVQPVEEIADAAGIAGITGYIVQTELPAPLPERPFSVIRVDVENTEFNEKGENLYFYEYANYNQER